jgi:hypothetical protein
MMLEEVAQAVHKSRGGSPGSNKSREAARKYINTEETAQAVHNGRGGSLNNR